MTGLYVGLGALGVATAIILYLINRPDTNWHPFRSDAPVRLLDGTTASGHLMRRWAAGAWQYRQETPVEEGDNARAESR